MFLCVVVVGGGGQGEGGELRVCVGGGGGLQFFWGFVACPLSVAVVCVAVCVEVRLQQTGGGAVRRVQREHL